MLFFAFLLVATWLTSSFWSAAAWVPTSWHQHLSCAASGASDAPHGMRRASEEASESRKTPSVIITATATHHDLSHNHNHLGSICDEQARQRSGRINQNSRTGFTFAAFSNSGDLAANIVSTGASSMAMKATVAPRASMTVMKAMKAKTKTTAPKTTAKVSATRASKKAMKAMKAKTKTTAKMVASRASMKAMKAMKTTETQPLAGDLNPTQMSRLVAKLNKEGVVLKTKKEGAKACSVTKADSSNPKKTKTTETKTTAKAIDEYETATEWEAVPLGCYWNAKGRPKWKYVIVEKCKCHSPKRSRWELCRCQWPQTLQEPSLRGGLL